MKQSYEDLEIYQLSKTLAIEVHRITLDELPKFEMYEEGSQIRRSSKSIGANIQLLTYALASCDETKYHLEVLQGTLSLKGDKVKYFLERYNELGRKIFNFRRSIIDE